MTATPVKPRSGLTYVSFPDFEGKAGLSVDRKGVHTYSCPYPTGKEIPSGFSYVESGVLLRFVKIEQSPLLTKHKILTFVEVKGE